MTERLPAGGLPATDLSADFAPPRRRVTPLTPLPPAQPASEPAEPARESTEPIAAPEPAPPAPATPSEPTVVEAESASKRQLILYVTGAQRDWLRKAAVGSTQRDVILDAIEQAETAGELGAAVREAQQPDTSGLFERTRTVRGDQVQISLLALASHIAVMDRLVARHDAPNRSALVRAAIDYAREHSRRRA